MKTDDMELATVLLLLRGLGLTKYESLAYFSLVREGPQNCRSLSRQTDIPSGRIYSVMNSLVKGGWARIAINERPKIYYPVDPQIAIHRRITEIRGELEHLEIRANRISNILKAMYHNHTYFDESIFTNNNHIYKYFVLQEKK